MDIGWSNLTERKFELDTPVKIIHLNIRGFCSKSEELTLINIKINPHTTIRTEHHMLKQDVTYQSRELPLGI